MSVFLDTEAREDGPEDGYVSDEIPLTSANSLRLRTKGRGSKPVISSSSSSESDSDSEALIEALSTLKKKKSADHHQPEPSVGTIGPADVAMIMGELKKTNSIITALARKVKRTDQRTMAIEEQLQSSNASSTSTPKRPRKRAVPDAVRVRT